MSEPRTRSSAGAASGAAERLELRLQLAAGHWELGEWDEAVDALERAAREGRSERLRALVGGWLRELAAGGGPPGVDERLQALVQEPQSASAVETRREDPLQDDATDERTDPVASEVSPALDAEHEALPPVATSTMAELLAEQGHAEQALRVAEEVLRRHPGDARAQAVRARLDPGARDAARTSGSPRVVAELERWLGNLERARARHERGSTPARLAG